MNLRHHSQPGITAASRLDSEDRRTTPILGTGALPPLAVPVIPGELVRKRPAATVRRTRNESLPITPALLALFAACAVFLAGAIAATPAGLIAGTLLVLLGSVVTYRRNR